MKRTLLSLAAAALASLAAAGVVGCTPASRPAPAPPAANVTSEDAVLPEPSIAVTEAMGSPHIGDAAPDFDLPDQDGKHVSLAAARGSVIVLAFVASFCPFSKAEQPYLKKLAEDYKGKNVRVIAIGIKEPEADYREYVARMPMGLPVLRDDGGAVALRFTPPGAQPEFKDRTMALVTSNLVIDPKGKIRFFTVVDTVHFDAKLVHVRHAVDQVLAESAPPVWERPGLGGAVRPEMGSPQPGELAPELTLPDREGRPVSLSSMRGNWAVLHFTATWCPFCDSEVEHLNELARTYAPRGVRTVIIDVKEPAPSWRAYAAKHVSPDVVALLDASGDAARRFAPPRAQPSFEDRAQAVLDGTLIVDPAGRIRLFLLPDSAHFDPTFGGVRAELDRMLPEPVVTVSAEASPAFTSERAEIAVTLRIGAGYHVMSERPSEPTYVATRVTIEPAEGIVVGEASYPPSTSSPLAGREIATFAGTIVVRVPVLMAAGRAPGPRILRGEVRYQACTATRCLFPVTRAFEVRLAQRASVHFVQERFASAGVMPTTSVKAFSPRGSVATVSRQRW